MELLVKVLTSMVRRVLTGAAVSVLTVLVAKGLIGVDLRDEIFAWLSGDAAAWIVTSLIALGGIGLTYIDKYVTKLKLKIAKDAPAGVSHASIVEDAKAEAPAMIAPFVN